jgi:hypothetical protein
MTLKLSKSHMKNKRYRIDLADGRHYDVGLVDKLISITKIKPNARIIIKEICQTLRKSILLIT